MSQPLSPEERRRLESLFDQAADLPPAEHAAFLERQCPPDDPLHDELARLLAGLAAEDVLGQIQTTVPSRVGARIGPYELLEKVGEGGMGEVYAAQQREPVRRQVALKLIKPGMDTQQVIARFEAERQSLAMMDHPHIAKVLDAGSTDAGQPYFVMEYIEGVPLIDYCDRQRLNTRARLQLFVSVCQAIQHAHQKGIIHRDIKPSNVMVTLHDGRPVPKVIDFGVAKAIHSDVTASAALTRNLQLVGTPAYMSPEQAGMSAQDIDTRSDVYSLGVLLYELLTGTTPFDSRQLSEANLAEMVRRICEETPHKPSTRISSLGDEATRTAVQRRVDGRRLALDLRGDLDWIVMKCLEKDRARRYETANGLAADLVRHLRDEPVTAGPPSKSYRLRKFVRRNRVGVTAAVLVAVVVVLGAGGTTWGLLWALDEKERADGETTKARLATATAVAAQAAEKEQAEDLRQVADFQAAQLGRVDPMTMGARSRRELIAAVPEERREELEQVIRGVNFTDLALSTLEHDLFGPRRDAIDAQFQDQPAVQAQLLAALAGTLYQVGLYELATEPMERAWELKLAEYGPVDWRTYEALNGRGVLLFSKGRLAEAEPLLAQALVGLQRTLGRDHPVTLNSLDCQGDLLRGLGRLDEAEECFREVLEARHKDPGDNHRDTLESHRVLGAVLREQGRYEEAEIHLRRALEGQRQVLPEDDWQTLSTVNSLAVLCYEQGRMEEAVRYQRESLQGSRRRLGNDHPVTLGSMSNLSGVLLEQGEFQEALSLAEESVRRHRAVLGDGQSGTLLAIADQGAALVSVGRFVEALPLLQEAHEGQCRTPEADPKRWLSTLNNLGLTLRRLGRSAEALPVLEEALEGHARLHPGDHPTTLVAISNLAGALKDVGRLAESEERYREVLAGRLRTAPGSKEAFMAMDNLALLLHIRGKLEEARELFEEALEGERQLLGEEHVDTLVTMLNLAGLLAATGDATEAEDLYREAIEGFRRQPPAYLPYIVPALNNLGILLRDQERFSEAEEYLSESLDGLRRVYPEKHPSLLATARNLGFVILAQGRPGEALPLFEEALEGFQVHGNSTMIHDLQVLIEQAQEALEQTGSAGDDDGR